MKKTFFTLIVCFLAISTFAQKITEKELLGKWRMTETTMGKSFIDLKNGTAKIDPEFAKGNGMTVPEMEAIIKENMAAMEKYVDFRAGSKVEMAIYDNEMQEYDYTIYEKDNNQILKVQEDEMKIWFDGAKLKMFIPSDEMDMTATFERVAK